MQDFLYINFMLDAVLIAAIGVCTYVLIRQKTKLKIFDDSFETPENGLVFFDEKEQFQKANERACKFMSFLSKEKEGSFMVDDFLNYLYDHSIDFDQSLRNAIDQVAGQQPEQSFREVIEWGEGKICLVEALNTKGKRIIFIINDISDLRAREENFLRVNQANHELTQAIEASTIGTVITDPKKPENPVIFSNSAFCELLDVPALEMIGRSWDFMLGALGDDKASQALFKAIEEQEDADIEIRLPDRDDPRWFNVKLTPVFDRMGRLDLFIGVFTETTALKLQEAEIFQGQKLEALGQLAAGVAHDFNNILSIIDGYLRMVGNEVEDNSKVSEYIQRTRMATQRGASLTKRMLMFSRHKIISQSVVDLCRLVKGQEALLLPLLDASINLTVATPSEEICVECTPDAVGQVLMNFAINGRDAMPDGGSLMIEVKMVRQDELPAVVPREERNQSFACFSVSDNGTGMDKETISRVFDPFFTTKDQGKGTGLGLSMVYGLVKEMGGYISVDSNLGRGTTMSVYLPGTDKEPTKQVVGTQQDIENLQMKGYTALVAEDEPDLRLLVSDMLEKLGMTVLQAENGNEALALQDNHEGDIDVLITDVVMPELNGVKLAELFQSLREETKIIYMSGYPANGNMARVELPEDAFFMAKPVQYKALANLVYQRLKESNAAQMGSEAETESARWETGGSLQK